MTKVKLAAIAGAAFLLATGAAAVAKMAHMAGEEALLIQPSADYGMVSYKTNDDLAKHARLTDGALFYRKDGKLYVVENKKMSNGNMLFEDNLFKRSIGSAGASP